MRYTQLNALRDMLAAANDAGAAGVILGNKLILHTDMGYTVVRTWSDLAVVLDWQ